MKYKHIFFDFDGTLADTLPGITAALNALNKELGIDKVFDNKTTKTFIGNGAEKLFLKAYNLDQLDYNTRVNYERYLALYRELQLDNMGEFPYVYATLKELSNSNIKLYIYSNKPHDILLSCTEKLFSDIHFELVLGNIPGQLRKPNPSVIDEFLRKNNIDKKDVLYVGDSMPDLIFSRNLGVDSMILTYGYGDYKAIKEADPTYLVNDMKSLLDL